VSFHLFHINELYSNADGSVQFIEFVGDANGQEFWAGNSLISSNGAQTNTYNFATNLPSSSTFGKTVLVATQGFADLGIVTPDYIVPNGFLFTGGGTVTFPGMDSVTHAALPTDGTSSINRGGTIGTNSPTNFAGASGTIQSNVIAGDDGPNNLFGTAGDDVIQAAGGNDTLTGGAGNDTVDGGSGIDTAVLGGNRSAYAIGAAGTSVSGPDGSDTLTNIERLQFSDKQLAFDLGPGQAAGNTVRIIGAAFDANHINPTFVGIGVDLFDGGMSMLQVCQLALGTSLFLSIAGSTSNEAFVNTVYENVVGAPPSDAVRDSFVGLLQGSGGTLTQAELLALAANAAVNATNINLVGLQQSGVEFA
jgi:serralysin